MAFFVYVYFFISSCSWEQVAGSYQKNDCSVIARSWESIILVMRYTLLICFASDLQKLELTSARIHFMVSIALSIRRSLLALS